MVVTLYTLWYLSQKQSLRQVFIIPILQVEQPDEKSKQPERNRILQKSTRIELFLK